MNEKSIYTLYKILNHKNYWSRIGSLDTITKQYEDKLLQGFDEVLEYARKWNGIRNLFIGRNPRDSTGKVLYSSCISFDIDPIRQKGEAANDEQHNNAFTAGQRILEKYSGGVLASSGNGGLLLYPCSRIDDLDDYYRREKVFIESLNKLVEDLNVKIDSTSYAEAVIKLIGTISTKGNPKDQRLSRFIVSQYNNDKTNVLFNEIQSQKVQVNKTDIKKFSGDPVERIKEAQEALNKLPNKFLNEYECWLKVGMSLKEFGISGLQLWREWSKKGTKYEEGICEKKWETFKKTPEVTLGSLKYWAKENQRTFGISKPISLSNDSYFSRLFSPNSDIEKPILTGISNLDTCLRALPKGEITTIAARSGYGKSSFACTIAEYLRKEGKRILYFSTEMSYEYIMHKFVSIATGISLAHTLEKSFSEEEIRRIKTYEQELLLSPRLTICDEFSPKIELVKDWVEKEKPDLLIFDHATQSGTHWEYIAQFVRGLKEITSQYNIVTLLASQLNEPPRSQKGDIGPSIRGDIRGSQEIIFLSAIFMMMNNLYEVKGNIQPVELEICKNRFGLSGIKLEIRVDKETGKFYN